MSRSARDFAWRRFLPVQPGEGRAFVFAFVYFFALIGSYMMLRPVRETLAVRGGETEYLFTAVFFVMLLLLPTFGWLVARLPKRVFLPVSYLFFIVNLVGFGVWLDRAPQDPWAGRVFFVWLSVFNLFVVSVFWSLMVDVFRPDAARRLFGPIAAGGSLGGILGPTASILAVDSFGTSGLVTGAALLLGVSLVCQLQLLRYSGETTSASRPIGGSVLAGAKAVFSSSYLAGIALVLVFLPLLNTFMYFLQQEMVADAFATDEARLKWFGAVDLATQALSLLLQFVITPVLLGRIGAAWTLLIVPVVTLVGLAVLAVTPGILVLGVLQALRRGGEYGLMKPARELLFTPVSEEAKYKAKNFIDTAVYRGGDMSSGWLYRGLSEGLGLGVAAIAATGMVAAAFWASIAHRMGRRFEAGDTGQEQT